eukprot:jgi/Tetstr1/432942/TSEL_022280.t1
MARGAEELAARLAALEDNLQQSDLLTGTAVGILDELEGQLTELARVTRPIYTRTQALTWARGNIKQVQRRADEVLQHMDVSRKVEKRIRAGPSDNLDQFLAHVQQLNRAIDFLQSHQALKAAGIAIRHASELRAEAIRQCEAKFREALAAGSVKLEFPALAGEALEFMNRKQMRRDSRPGRGQPAAAALCLEPLEVVQQSAQAQLTKLADIAMSATSGNSCNIVKIYCERRQAVGEELLRASGVDPAMREELHRLPWDALEKKIQGWIVFAHVVSRLIAAERKLAESVFGPPYNDLTFSEAAHNVVDSLVTYGKAIAAVRRTPEKVFALLDMQEHLGGLQDVMEDVLRGTTCAPLLKEVHELLARLAFTAHGTFAEFEDAVSRNDTRHVVHDGTVHPLTAYVINYVKRLFSYRSTLVTLFKEVGEDGDITPREGRRRGDDSGLLSSRIAGSIINILMALFQNLQEKAETYKDEALQQLFLMNNLNYVVTSMQSYGSSQLLPEDWVSRHRALVATYRVGYLKVSWEPVYQILRGELDTPTSKKERQFVKDRFRTLNKEVEALHKRHKQWAIPDRICATRCARRWPRSCSPATSASTRTTATSFFSRNPDKYMKYTAKDLQKMVEEDLSPLMTCKQGVLNSSILS